MRRVNECVDAVFVVSVRSFKERITHIENELGSRDIRFEFMFGFDPEELDDQLIAAHFAPSAMKKTHQSLVMKNVGIWRKSIESGYERILVFEDDAVLDRAFVSKFDAAMQAADKLAPGWLVFLGGHDTKVPDQFFLETGPFFELPIATTEAYVCDLESIKKRLKWIQENRAHLAFDHQLRLIDKEMGIRQYWLTQPLVQQGSVLGIFSSALDGSRNRHPRLYNTLRNRWNKFQRHAFRRFWVRAKAAIGLIRQ